MQELCFKNHFKALFLILVTIAIAAAAARTEVALVEVPLPVYILGLLAGFLVLSSIFYPKASTGQTVQLSILGILINTINFFGVYYAVDYFKISEIVLKPDFIISLSPMIVGTTFVFSLLTLCVLVKTRAVQDSVEEETNISEDEEDIGGEDESVEIEVETKEESVQEVEHYVPTVSFDFKSDEEPAEADKVDETPSTYAELYPEAQKDASSPEGNDLEELQENKLDDIEIKADTEEKVLAEDDIFEPQKPSVENPEFIPTNIRLSEVSASKEPETKGKVGSIGKLLVNDRDIENVIESNEAMEESVLNSRTNIISTISGEKIYKKFSEIKNEFTSMREIALIDNGGFVLANDFEDPQRAQIAGALIAGVYHTLQNYLAQVSLDFPVRIFFETAGANSFIEKTKEEILFSSWDKDFAHIEYGPLQELVGIEDFSQTDLTPYVDMIKIENMTVSDFNGNLVNSLDAENTRNFAAVSTAIFENLKVFLMNIQLIQLSKIVIFTPQKVMTILKTQDNIISLLTNSQDYPKIKEELLKIEEM